ncbi:hypothetical protein [Streptomyces sp. RG80]|uniref:hypothetical protein n=1 Tax=Streptomyces sp. RG80 TaxID=3157340 RepID=UPI00338DF8C9
MRPLRSALATISIITSAAGSDSVRITRTRPRDAAALALTPVDSLRLQENHL